MLCLDRITDLKWSYARFDECERKFDFQVDFQRLLALIHKLKLQHHNFHFPYNSVTFFAIYKCSRSKNTPKNMNDTQTENHLTSRASRESQIHSFCQITSQSPHTHMKNKPKNMSNWQKEILFFNWNVESTVSIKNIIFDRDWLR